MSDLPLDPEALAAMQRARVERFFAAVESQPDGDERERSVRLLMQPATKLDIAAALVFQSQMNTELARVLTDLFAGRSMKSGSLIEIANLQESFGREMLDFLAVLVSSDG